METETKDTRYNGWTNYETWNVKLWIDNDEGSYRYWREIAQEMWDEAVPGQYDWQTREDQFLYAFSARMKDEHEENTPETVGVYADLLTAALGEVDWREIAQSYFDCEIDKTDETEE